MSPEALKAAREMAEEAWKKRLAEIDMSEGEAELYDSLLSAVRQEVQQTRVLLESREARQAERVWLTVSPPQRSGHEPCSPAALMTHAAGLPPLALPLPPSALPPPESLSSRGQHVQCPVSRGTGPVAR